MQDLDFVKASKTAANLLVHASLKGVGNEAYLYAIQPFEGGWITAASMMCM
jgi:hypothetical protein